MEQVFDDANSQELADIFFRKGKVIFLLSRREAILLKRATKTEMKLAMLRSQSTLSGKARSALLMAYGIFQTTYLSFFHQNLENIYSFYLLNKSNIRNIDEKPHDDGNIIVTYFAKRA